VTTVSRSDALLPAIVSHIRTLTQELYAGQVRLILEVSRSVGRTPLDEGSARRRDFCLTTHKTHKRKTSIRPAGLSRSKRSVTDFLLDRWATGIGVNRIIVLIK
jgi:hypothetical protein